MNRKREKICEDIQWLAGINPEVRKDMLPRKYLGNITDEQKRVVEQFNMGYELGKGTNQIR